MLRRIRQSIFITLVSIGWLFYGFPNLEFAQAAIGDIGHWRDSAGGQIPTAAFTAVNFNQEIKNEGIYTKPSANTIELDEAGDYLIIATMRDQDGSNGRYNSQARISLVSALGGGDLFTSYYSGYSRDNSENNSWTRAVGVLIGAAANTQIQVQKRRDTDVPTLGSIAGASDVQVIRINPTEYGIYSLGGTGNAYGGTTPNLVDITAINAQSNISAIEGNTTTDTITIKGDNKKYLLAWSVSGNTGGARTQRIGHLEYDGVDELPTRSYCYQRNAANEYCGFGSMDLIETGSADINIQTEVFRGPGVAADQGGADSNGSWVTDGNGQIIVLEMPEYLETFRSYDSTGLQNLSSAATLNIARVIDFNDPLSFTKASNTAVNVTNPADIFSWTNIWTARNNITSGARQTSFGAITINGTEQTTGRHGNYSRGNQSSTDTFAMSFHPAGIFSVLTAGQNIGVSSNPLPGGENGGIDRTQANTLGFFSLNLDTFVKPQFEQSAYRLFNNVDSTDVGTPLSPQDTSATLDAAGDAFRLRSLINISENQLRQNETNFKLQFAEQVGTCDTGFVGESYSDVNLSSLIAFNDNPSVVDGDNLLPNVNDPINGLNTVVNQDYEEQNDLTPSVSAIGQDQDGKWDFSLVDNGAPADTTYCLRIVESDNTLLNAYSVIPEITTFAGGVVPQTLTFDVFDSDNNNAVGFGELTISDAKFATADETGALTSTNAASISASTNASNGYVVEIDGITLTNENGDSVAPIGITPTASVPGSSQFGLRANTTGTGNVAPPYNDGINHAYDTGLFVDEFATGVGDNTVTIHDLEFIANIDPLTPAGEYIATVTFTMHAEFN